MKLKNKTCLITGGASGMGFLAGLHLAKRGANVVLADINEKELEKRVDEIRRTGEGASVPHVTYGTIPKFCTHGMLQ